MTTLSRDLYKGETFSMNREDGWRQAYTCIRDFSRESDYQEGMDRPERYTAFFEKGADASTRVYVNGAWTLETTGTWDAEWEICRGYPDGSNYLPNRPELVWHSVKSFQQREGFRNNFTLSGNEEEMSYYKIRLIAYKDGLLWERPYSVHQPAPSTMKWWWRNMFPRAAPILRMPFICPIIR